MAIWNCPSCGEDNDSDFGICWNCGAQHDGGPPASDFVRDDVLQLDTGVPEERDLKCLRCGTPMKTLGRLRFHEGTRALPVVYGQLGELLVNRESFDAYACASPDCGKVEFFAITLEEVSLGG
ncbi:MAG: DUF7577 domain-containing protein [Pseudomonadota bacterium]|jgi:hypothetical protein